MTWTDTELAAIDRPDEIRIAPDRADGSAGPAVIVWAAAANGDLYARSARGPQGAWYRRALASGHGRIVVSGTEHEVSFEHVTDEVDQTAIDDAYRAKYRRYGRTVDSVSGTAAHAVTVRIRPVD
jgi:hypothetical protein